MMVEITSEVMNYNHFDIKNVKDKPDTIVDKNDIKT